LHQNKRETEEEIRVYSSITSESGLPVRQHRQERVPMEPEQQVGYRLTQQAGSQEPALQVPTHQEPEQRGPLADSPLRRR
jgi:hypothetical protein